uniref:C2H2-type domain-containing protein n=1 Tax=Ascaris lumbricoides TaxID=6252 RepID=A0A0M3HNJ3_ASCLU
MRTFFTTKKEQMFIGECDNVATCFMFFKQSSHIKTHFIHHRIMHRDLCESCKYAFSILMNRRNEDFNCNQLLVRTHSQIVEKLKKRK